MKVRELAYFIVNSVYKNKAFSNIELSQTIRSNKLSDQDRGFLTRLVYGTLQNAMMLDYEIACATSGKNIRPEMRTLLKVALYQLRHMDRVPDYAVINETVEIAKEHMGFQASKFANAVLRNLQRQKYEPKEDDFKDRLSYLSLIHSTPEWVVKMMAKHYGEEVAVGWLKSNTNEAPLTVRVNTLKSSCEELINSGNFVKTNLSATGLKYIGSEPIASTKEFLEGKFVVQDESGQLVAQILNPQQNDYILDMCAAPGSKTYHIAALLNNTGKIVAVDLHDHRIKLLESNLPRLGIINVKTRVYDSTKLLDIFEENTFDKILLDAPCSGLGVVRRKPDILINLDQNKLDDIISVQQKLINQAVKLVKVGGTLVYSTCTLNKKENEKQVEYLLNNYPNFKLVDSRILFPHQFDSDGFFIAKFVKEEE